MKHHKRGLGFFLLPYLEKSAKDTTFDAKADDFSALDKLDKGKAIVFSCNGPECWKSYKAAKVAAEKGFKPVYWFRGGLPEWDERNMPTASN
jgi:rhodanese-related sulfurtransferase